MISIRARRRIVEFGTPLAVFVVVVMVLAWVASGKHASFVDSIVHWLWALPAFLGLWFLLEYAGSRLLSLPFWQRLPAWARISMLVGLMVMLALLVLAVAHVQ